MRHFYILCVPGLIQPAPASSIKVIDAFVCSSASQAREHFNKVKDRWLEEQQPGSRMADLILVEDRQQQYVPTWPMILIIVAISVWQVHGCWPL